ncbi:MAG: CCA tRNA nucleotidyltransferase, mitochondrial, partial [Vezdaea aestivalis]
MAHRQTSTIRLFREQHVNIPITFLRAKQLCPSKKHIEQSGHWYSANTQPLKNLEARQRLDMRQLRLTKSEERIRALMLDVSADINKSKTPGTSLTVTRFTGGWVRDKLLGEESHDIDVSISDMTGAKFVESVRDYLAKPENAKAHNFQENEISRLASYIVSSNPDKSKHLETANMRLFLKEVDFVNLRKEQYAKDSRTPIMEFGTAQEDAFRRDATLNALFYNLDTEEVEDWTRTGLEDLSTGLLRTPLDPMQTFDDDPLRALRLIRFASRLGFTIEPKAEASMASIGIKESLKTKISRERVQIEITKMLK